ncbi:MAG: endolytic transglycosylase MltG [Rhodothermus sp.]|nr:endolytic transglycosylase MltG [Rhodothermus sp.]
MKRWIAGIVLILLLCAGGLVGIALAPNTPAYEGTRGVKIPRAATFPQVVDSLQRAGILRYQKPFVWLARLTGWHRQIKAGYYTFEAGASNYHLLSVLRRGLQTPVRVTIPPGSRPEVVAALVCNALACPPDSMLAALRDSNLAAELRTDTNHLFGRLLPDTYFFYWLTDPRTVIRRVHRHFLDFFTPERRARADSLGLTIDEVITLASIVEWEARPEERPRIAGVYLNRLRRGMPLQADPTVQYAILQREGQKRRLLFADYRIAHPYNTYRFRGLPPGPITNPSPNAIDAVLYAEAHDYLYFVADGEGGHIFSRTFREHVQAANRYRRLMQQRRREARTPTGDEADG